MGSLTLTCFGEFQVMLDGEHLTNFQTDKVRALLIYLALEAHVHLRTDLAQFLWPGYSADSANNSLRQSLHRLRQLLRGSRSQQPLLLSTRQTIQLNPEAVVTVDVTRFRNLLAQCTAHDHIEMSTCALCLARLQQAVALYSGDFLAGFTVADSDPFEEWRRIIQEQCHLEALDALTHLGYAAEAAGDEDAAQRAAERQLALEPWLESAHRRLMRILAGRGQRAAAIAQYQRCRQVLADEFGVEPDAETVALYEQIRRSQEPVPVRSTIADVGRPLKRTDGAPSLGPSLPQPLPMPLTPLIGRVQEVAALAARLQEPDVRLLTIVGVGGMGKTRLAIEVGRTVQETFADGVCYVELAAVRTATALASAIAVALRIPLQGGEPRDLLLQALRRQQLLLILDNLEHLLGAEITVLDLVGDLLMAAPELRILVTSRERLKLRYEQIYVIPALAFAPTVTLSDATDMAAVRLFVQAAQRSQPLFQLTDVNVAAVLRICQLVQGMPLGLELAAANSNQLPPDAIADALAQSAELLAVDWHDLPERQRSMRAVFDWSWQLLSAPEQRVLRQSAHFRGGFTAGAAHAVTGATLPLLTSLVDKSLLQWHGAADGEGRYTIHELLRQFADEALQESSEYDAITAHHGRYYLTYLASRGFRLARNEPKEASQEIQAELDNIRQAWHWAATQGLLAELDQAAYSWWQFCQFSDLTIEGRQSFAVAVEGVRQRLARLSVASPLSTTATTVQLGKQLLAKLLAIYADYLFAQGRDQEMAAQADEAIRLGAESGGVEGETFGTFVRGRAAQELGQLQEAGDLWRRVIHLVSLYQPSHPKSELLHDAHWMAHNWLRGNELAFKTRVSSRNHMVQALQICQALGKRRGELYCLSDLAWTDFYFFDFATAESGFHTALALANTLGYRRSEMIVRSGLGEVLRARGEYRQAHSLLQQAAALAAELAHPYDEAHILALLARLYCQLGNQRAAALHCEQLAQMLAAQKLPFECHLQHALATAYIAHTTLEIEAALSAAEVAEDLYKSRSLSFRFVDVMLIVGHTRAAAGQWEPAAVAFQQALTTLQQFGNRPLAAEAHAGLAQVALAQGDLVGAQKQVEAYLPVLELQPHAGYNNAFCPYLIGYRVLAANGDARAADLLQRGHTLLLEDAAPFDGESRQRFLTAVPIHRELLSAHQALHQPAPVHEPVAIAGSPTRPIAVAPSPSPSPSSFPLLDWHDMPVADFFTGRSTEVAQLTAWLMLEKERAPVRLVSILGLGGMGKTTLAAHVARTLAPTFSVVIWRSLLNAPPPTELLGWWLQRLARQQPATIPDSLDEQLRLLINYLQQERCLLILDNVESLFAGEEIPGRAGVMRAGYVGYDQLLQRLAMSEHQSTLLLTSREQPYALNRLGRQAQAEGGPLRVLALGGLDQQAGHQFLQNNGLAASVAEAALLIKNYSGNPLALQIAAATIADFFGGDVSAFQQEEGGLFDGMRLVLDQQFARLSPLERELLIWLAIEREPVTVSTLRGNLVQGSTTGELLEALQALQGRSLLENREGALTLQNVIIEYTTEYLIEQIYLEILGETQFAPADHHHAALAGHPLTVAFLNRFALRKTQAKAYVQQSQTRLLLQPVAERLVARLGRAPLLQRVRDLLNQLRTAAVYTGYAGGNLCNLLIQLGEDLSDYDFSHLPVWQADLRGLLFVAPDFTGADLKNTLFTAGITITTVKFRPGGEMWIAGIDNSELCLWRTVNGQLVDGFRSAGNVRKPLVFNDDGAHLAVADVDHRIQIWSTVDGRCIQTLAGHQGTVYALVFSPDGQYLASAGVDQSVRLWEPASGRCCQRLTGYEQGVEALAFSPDGQILAIGSGDGSIQLWKIQSTSEDGELISTLDGHTRMIGALAFTPDGALLASGSHDGAILLWSLANLTETGNAPATCVAQPVLNHTDIVRVLLFQPQPTQTLSTPATSHVTYQLASGSSNQIVSLWEISTGISTVAAGVQLRYTLLGHGHELEALSFSADGQQLASCGADQQVYVWDVHSGQAISSLQAHHYGLNSVAVSPDGRRIAIGGTDRIVHVWQSSEQEPVRVQPHLKLRGHEHFLRDVAFSPSSRVLASSGVERIIRLWDSDTGQPLPTLIGHTGAVWALAFAPQYDADPSIALLASAGADRTIRLWSISEVGQRTPQFQRQLTGHTADILMLAFTPDGKQLITGCMDGSVWIWNVASGMTEHQLLGHTTAVTFVSVAPDGRTVATSSFDYTVRIWDIASGRCLHVEKEGPVGAMSVAFGRLPGGDEPILAYGGDDFAIHLWSWQTKEVRIALRGHRASVTRLVFHPTAPLLISSSHDNSMRIWDLTTMACRQVLQPAAPYAGMRIGGVRGISDAQKAALVALGAVEG